FYHRGRFQPGVAAGVDALEGFAIHGDVERQAVEGAAAAHADPERGDLGAAVHVDARRARAALRMDTPNGQGVDDRLFDAANVLAHADAQAPEVEQRIRDQLAGAVIGHLAAAVDLE